MDEDLASRCRELHYELIEREDTISYLQTEVIRLKKENAQLLKQLNLTCIQVNKLEKQVKKLKRCKATKLKKAAEEW